MNDTIRINGIDLPIPIVAEAYRASVTREPMQVLLPAFIPGVMQAQLDATPDLSDAEYVERIRCVVCAFKWRSPSHHAVSTRIASMADAE